MDKLTEFQKEFITNCCYRMDESVRMIEIAMEKFDETQVWQRPNSSLNSLGNLILHLCGNMTQYGIDSLKDQADRRDRDAEFDQEDGMTKAELLQQLRETVAEVKATFSNTDTERLLAHRKVQGFDFSGIGNIIHVVEHFSYHTGQIAFWIKQLKDTPLGFYDGQELNTKNE